MKPIRRSVPVCICILVLGAVAACSREEASEEPASEVGTAEAPGAEVTSIRIGKSIGADKRVVEEASNFGPSETIYASVETAGTNPGSSLTARWTYEDGQVVDESTQTIAGGAGAITEFHVSKPDGWPVGSYQVAISLDGEPKGTRDFQVTATE